MKLRVLDYTVEEVHDAFLVLHRGRSICYFNTLTEAVAYLIIYDLEDKPRQRHEQITRVAQTLEKLLQTRFPSDGASLPLISNPGKKTRREGDRPDPTLKRINQCIKGNQQAGIHQA